MTKAQSNAPLTYAAIGEGVEAAVDPKGVLYLRIDTSGDGWPSGSGKMTLHGSTGGFANVPNSDGIRVNLNVGRKASAK